MSDRSSTGKRPGLRVIKNCKYFILVLAVANDSISCPSVYEKNIGALSSLPWGLRGAYLGLVLPAGEYRLELVSGPIIPALSALAGALLKPFFALGNLFH